MGRGKPFTQPLSRLVSAGVAPPSPWMSIVEATRPVFIPVKVTRPPLIEYPEDRLRNIYLRRNIDARRIPVDLKARSIPERHIADQFVSIQMQLMEEQGLAEEEAYNVADRKLSSQRGGRKDKEEDLHGPLASPNVDDEVARLYLASAKDSQRDRAMYRALIKQKEGNN